MLTTPWLLLRYGLRRTYTGAILVLLAGGAIGVSLVGIILEWRLNVYQSGLEASIGDSTAGTIRAFNETFLFTSVVCAIAILAARRMRAKGRGTNREIIPGTFLSQANSRCAIQASCSTMNFKSLPPCHPAMRK
jgi:hypothetical protein